jgi:hypothetical protein
MDLGTVLTGAILVAICIIPIYAMGMDGRKRKKDVLRALQQLASQHQITFSESDYCAYFAIGIDASGTNVCFVNLHPGAQQALVISLRDYHKAEQLQAAANIHQRGVDSRLVEKVGIRLHNGHHQSLTLMFYDMDLDVQLSREIALADKWVKRITAALKA